MLSGVVCSAVQGDDWMGETELDNRRSPVGM